MNRAEIVTMLGLVSYGLAKDDLVGVYSCFTFNGAEVVTYNDRIGVIAACPTNGAFAIRGKTLLGLLQNSTSETCEFKLSAEDVTVKAGKSTFKLPYLPKTDFIFEEPMDVGKQLIPINDELLAGLEACLLTTSRDLTQAKLMGVCINQQGSTITLYSCDGDALTRYNTTWAADDSPDCILPTEFCETVLKITKETDAKIGKLQLGKGWAKATLSTGYRIFGRLLEIDQPFDYAGELAQALKGKIKFVPVPKELGDALSRARVVADPESAKTVLTLDGTKMVLVTETHTGVVRDVLQLTHAPTPIEVHVSAELVQRSTTLADEMAVLEGCTVFRAGDRLLQVRGNMG